MALSYRLYETIEAVPSQDWDATLGPDSLLLSFRYLQAQEQGHLPGCRYWYILFYDEDRPVASAPVFSIDIYLDVLADERSHRLGERVRKLWPKFLKRRFLICGSPLSTGMPHCGFTSHLTRLQRDEILAQLDDLLLNLARQQRIYWLVYKEMDADVRPQFESLAARGYTLSSSLPTSTLTVHWKSWDDYLASLKKKVRWEFKNQEKLCQQAGITAEIQTDFAPLVPELFALYEAVYQKADHKFEHLTPDYFRALAQHLPGKVRFLLLRRNGRLVACEMLFYDEKTLRPMYVGLDYAENTRETPLYFYLLSWMVRAGIEAGVDHVETGHTTYEPKLKLGAEFRPLFVYMRHRQPLMNRLIKLLSSLLIEDFQVQQRRVFRHHERVKEENYG